MKRKQAADSSPCSSRKLKQVMTGLVAVSLPAAVDADVIYVDDRPVSLDMNLLGQYSSPWDIDGDGIAEFRMVNIPALGYSSTTYGEKFVPINLALADYNYTSNGAMSRLMGDGEHVARLPRNATVGPMPANYTWNSDVYEFMLSGRAAIDIYTTQYGYSYFVRGYSSTHFAYDFEEFRDGNNVMGFRFEINGNLHYGWANVNFSGRDVTISKWAYESIAGLPITVTVPESSSLAMLAMGAAGVLAQRRRRTLALE